MVKSDGNIARRDYPSSLRYFNVLNKKYANYLIRNYVGEHVYPDQSICSVGKHMQTYPHTSSIQKGFIGVLSPPAS